MSSVGATRPLSRLATTLESLSETSVFMSKWRPSGGGPPVSATRATTCRLAGKVPAVSFLDDLESGGFQVAAILRGAPCPARQQLSREHF